MRTRKRSCRTYWGSHGCMLPRGHAGFCKCDCCSCIDHKQGYDCVGSFPYYGKMTQMYGEDSKSMQRRLETAFASSSNGSS